jgi:hypothetical protein
MCQIFKTPGVVGWLVLSLDAIFSVTPSPCNAVVRSYQCTQKRQKKNRKLYEICTMNTKIWLGTGKGEKRQVSPKRPWRRIGSEGIAQLFLNLGTRWRWVLSRPGRFTPGKVWYPMTRRQGGPQSLLRREKMPSPAWRPDHTAKDADDNGNSDCDVCAPVSINYICNSEVLRFVHLPIRTVSSPYMSP